MVENDLSLGSVTGRKTTSRSRRLGHLIDEGFDAPKKFSRTEGLGRDTGDPEPFHQFVRRQFESLCGQHQDGNVASSFVLTQAFDQLQAIHSGHLAIGHDDVGNARLYPLERLDAVRGTKHLETGSAKLELRRAKNVELVVA